MARPGVERVEQKLETAGQQIDEAEGKLEAPGCIGIGGQQEGSRGWVGWESEKYMGRNRAQKEGEGHNCTSQQ